MKDQSKIFDQSELGKKSKYVSYYQPDILYPLPRKGKRALLAICEHELPFYGYDCWHHYEVSWLNELGKPVVAYAEIVYGADSPNIIESKSMKLYFNSLNQTKFKNVQSVIDCVQRDLSERVGVKVYVDIKTLDQIHNPIIHTSFNAICLDDLNIDCCIYQVDPTLLTVKNDEIVNEALYSDLLKSNCLVTGQPDWGSVLIHYSGCKINHEGLLRYIVSYREHCDFHEHCIERIFMDIMQQCKPKSLTIHGKYTRRGGLDINPYRSTEKIDKIENLRAFRQ